MRSNKFGKKKEKSVIIKNSRANVDDLEPQVLDLLDSPVSM